MNRKFAILGIALLVLLGFSGFFFLYEARFFTGRASVSQYSFSIDNSYVFYSPLQAQANGQESIRLTVFVLNNQGLGVQGKKVTLVADPNLAVETIQGLTDSLGKAIFDITSTKPADYYVDVQVEGVSLEEKSQLTFN
jgi:hypothetical protein